jgi:hypothetical protein
VVAPGTDTEAQLDQDSHAPTNVGFWSRLRERWSRGWRQLVAGARSSWLGKFVGEGGASRWQYIAGLLTGFFAALYAAQRFATSIFYDRLGVLPEEVGIGLTQNLEGVVIFLFLLILVNLFFLIPGFMAILTACARASSYASALWTAAKQHPEAALLFVVHRLAVLAVIVSFFVLVPVLKEKPAEWVALTFFAALGALFILSRFAHSPLWRTEIKDIFARQDIFRWAINGSTIIAGMLTIIFIVAWVVHASRDSAMARKGFGISGFPSVAWRTQRVSVSWLQPSLPPVIADLQGRCVMYLGQANGVTVLFEVKEQQILRVPTSGIILRTESSCLVE